MVEAVATQQLSAAEKKKLRRKRAKEGKKELKLASHQLHQALHKAQDAEARLKADSTSKSSTTGQAPSLLRSHPTEIDAHSVEYVAEPLTALEELAKDVQEAAIDSNPYEGLVGLEVDGEGTEQKFALAELERIAKHFAGASMEDADADAEEEAERATNQGADIPTKAEPAAEEDDEANGATNHFSLMPAMCLSCRSSILCACDRSSRWRCACNQSERRGWRSAEGKSNREIKRERNEHTSQMIAQLKQDCPRPEVVEVWDIRARDPKLLVFLKAYRNTVPVPRHWSQKRKYLQGKRGIEKPPFELPSFIGATGAAPATLQCSARLHMHTASAPVPGSPLGS